MFMMPITDARLNAIYVHLIIVNLRSFCKVSFYYILNWTFEKMLFSILMIITTMWYNRFSRPIYIILNSFNFLYYLFDFKLKFIFPLQVTKCRVRTDEKVVAILFRKMILLHPVMFILLHIIYIYVRIQPAIQFCLILKNKFFMLRHIVNLLKSSSLKLNRTDFGINWQNKYCRGVIHKWTENSNMNTN